MPKIVVNAFLTLDGVMQAPGAPDEDRDGAFAHGGWQAPYFDEVAGRLVTEGITDADGFVVTTTPGSWTAVFGFYGHVLRAPDLIPGQVRLLRSLLYGREAQLARIVLADDRNGTYVPLPTGH